MALGKDTKIIKQGVDKIIDILEGGGSKSEFSFIRRKVYQLKIENRKVADIIPLEVNYGGEQSGVRVYTSQNDGFLILASSSDEFPSELMDKEMTEVFPIIETILSNGKYQFFHTEEDSVCNTILFDDGEHGIGAILFTNH